MANVLYPKARQAFARGEIDWDADDIRLVLVDAGYVQADAHEFLSSVAGSTRVATSGAFTGKDSTDGICDAADVVVPAVSGDDIAGVVVYQHTGSDATAHLILFFDSSAAGVGIDVTPDGTGVRVRWSNGPLKVFRL